MRSVTLLHTSQLRPEELGACRALCEGAFDGEFSPEDWDHAQGGLHVLVRDGHALVAHASVVQRQLLHGSAVLRTGYVEAVVTAPEQRRRGHFTAAMEAVEGVVRHGYDVGALAASPGAARLYAARGWVRWAGTTAVLTRAGVRATPQDDGAVFLRAGRQPVPAAGELVCEWRSGDVW